MVSKASIIVGDWKEQRRLRAVELHRQGWTQQSIAEALGVSPGAVSQWMSRLQKEGSEALRARLACGTAPSLSEPQLRQLVELLERGAVAHGFLGDVWTRQRICDVIARHFGRRVSLATVSRIMKKIGWTRQTPVVRATQPNEGAIEDWKQTRWPALKESLSPRANDCLR
jgi:transposase